MKLNIENIFDRIKNAEVHTEPFEHLIIDDLLPNDFFKELAKELENDNFSDNYVRGPYGNKERFGVDITDYSAWKNSGYKITTTVHHNNYKSLIARKNIYLEFFINFLLKNEKEFYSLLNSKLLTERFQHNYFCHISMVKDSIGYEIETHTDDEQNIFTILFYVPETDVNKEFGLNVYKDINGMLNIDKKINLAPNRMIIFAPSKPNQKRPATWHAVERLSNKLIGTRNSFQIFFYRNDN